MELKINDKWFPFNGYVDPVNSAIKFGEECYRQGQLDSLSEIESMLKRLWERYEKDKSKAPKPHFTDAIALVTLVELDVEGEKYDN